MNGHNAPSSKPHLEITEQPAPKALRFRYECEGRSAGSIPGEHSTPDNRTYPTVRVVGFSGKEDIVIVVSCVTKNEPHLAHPHNLVGKDCREGICSINLDKETMTAVFSNLGIQCVKKRDIEAALRLRQSRQVDPFGRGFDHANNPSSIDLNCVRLCFQAIIKFSSTKHVLLDRAVSNPVYDKKAMSDLLITRLSHASAPARGGTEMMLLCEKITKEDIKVRFYEEVQEQEVWEGFADISLVHKQVAIAFKTPAYTLEVREKIPVYIQLYRPSDRATSEPVRFLFTDSGKQAFRLLRSLKPNLAVLASILADKDHPLTKELLKIRCDSASDYDSNDWGSESDNDSLDGQLQIDELVRFTDDDTSTHTTSNDDRSSKSSWFENNSLSYSSKEAIDTLTAARHDNLKELGVVFSENEDADELEGKHFLDFVSNMNKLKQPLRDEDQPEDLSKDSPEFRHYSSMQMAMKNKIKIPELRKIVVKSSSPVEHYESIAPPPRPMSVKPTIKTEPSLIESETLPPLPPKRVKKNPTKCLPPVPEKETKLAIIRKLLPKIGKSKKPQKVEATDLRSSVKCESKTSLDRVSLASGDMSLTEAEHYALYTSVAPRATDSEFDENSCYYSPVEAEPVK